VELIPGTEILLAADEGYGRHSSSNEELLLVPTPSDQPDDPLVRFAEALQRRVANLCNRTGAQDGKQQ
jgi:hypothetical protein